MELKKGQIVELNIEDLSTEGAGTGRLEDGLVVFVKGALPGDRIRAEITKIKKRYAFGRLVEICDESPWRQESLCEYCNICGGCSFGNISYDGQLAIKQKQVYDRLSRLGGIETPIVRDIIGMDSDGFSEDGRPYRYRNKGSMVVSTGGFMTKKGGLREPVHEPRIGFYRRGSHDVVDCQDCLLQSPAAIAAAEALRQFMAEDNITSYDHRWEKGLMRHMVVRTAEGTGEVMVVLVINGKAIPNAAKLIEMLDDRIYEAGYNLESVVLNINKKNTSEILGEECITIAGKPTIREVIGEMEFEISPLSFYQVNREQMVKLYDKVLEYAGISSSNSDAVPHGSTVLDLYCGVGTIGLFAAKRMNELGIYSAQVIGIESVKGAVLDANRNAVINGIVNARYVCGKAEDVLPQMVKESTGKDQVKNNRASGESFDEELKIDNAHVVILDPPRAGCDERLLEAVVKTIPERIVYVSCDPATLARDVKWLGDNGYEFVEATPVDMFPHTGHVETVVLMSKREK